MINHVRTLLMNVVAEPGFLELGEEFIEPDFTPRTLTGPAVRYRRVLFGNNPDRAMLNYRMRQLLPLLHETDLYEYVLQADSRITYSFDDNPFFDPTLYRPTIKQLSGSPRNIYLLGPPIVPDSIGIVKHVWDIKIRSGNTVDVHRHSTIPSVTNNYSYTVSDGLSSHIPVPGSPSNYFIFEEGSVGDMWRISWYARPQASLGTLLSVARSVDEPARIELFGLDSHRGKAEPLRTFYNLFADSRDTALALGGLLLAIVDES